jgi:hypothetical protein
LIDYNKKTGKINMIRKSKKYNEGEISIEFNLKRNKSANLNNVLLDWIERPIFKLNDIEQYIFNKIITQARNNIDGWNEEELKMKFLAHIIDLLALDLQDEIHTFFERTVEATVDEIYLKTKTDFMIAKGVLGVVQTPYFHFQEYKKSKDPNGDPAGQLLQAFLIAQEINKNGKPMYGAYIIGRFWYFVVFQNREYCVSRAFDSTQEDGLMQIIAILRHFKVILETKLLVD